MINKIGIIGLGAVGGMYADRFRRCFDRNNIVCIAGEERIARYIHDGVYVNGKRLDITFMADKQTSPLDLLIIATKFYSIEEAMASASYTIGSDTIVMSFMNGVVSEEMIADRLHPAHLLYTTVQGMDAGKVGNQITYHQYGSIAFGEKDGKITDDVRAVGALMDTIGMPYINPEDMMRQLYNKWMMNVGVNQTCAYYACTYSDVQPGGKYRDTYIAAMEEAKTCANAEGIHLTDDDLNHWLDVLATLSPDGEPSMRQDTKAERPTEAGLFCGTVIKIAEKHNIEVPINQMFHKQFVKGSGPVTY